MKFVIPDDFHPVLLDALHIAETKYRYFSKDYPQEMAERGANRILELIALINSQHLNEGSASYGKSNKADSSREGERVSEGSSGINDARGIG